MIPILFAANETTFTSNGIGRLADATRCEVTEERNGVYELVMEYPIKGKLFDEIACGRYIFATHDESKVPQAFQIYRVSVPLEGMVTINAWHISYALNTIIVEPFTAGSCTAAIAGVKTHSMNTNPFTFWTDKSVTADFETVVPMSARAILGGVQGSILDVYGTGEYEFDMYTVKLHLNRGQNRGVSIRYGKNLTKLDQVLDASNIYNACVPYWTNGETSVVSDVIITKTGETTGRTIAMDLSADFDEEPTLAQLKARAQVLIDNSDNYTLKENIKIDFVALWQTEEYKNFASLQRIYLCDTVNIFYEKAGINVTAQCIKVIYDSLRERYIGMELGEPTTSLIQEIQRQVVGDVLSQVPSKSQMQAAIDKATELIAGGFGGYIKFNYLSDGTPSEMLVMDSPSESTATNIIRLNQNGLGFSTDGGATYANAWTIDGNLNASFITTGVLDADLMTAGMIQDSSGENYWNLDTGQFVTKQGEIADFIIDQTSLRSGTVGQGTNGTSITDGTWESTKTGTITSSGNTYQYTVKTKISNGGIEMYSSRDDIDADLVQVLKIEPHVWYVNGTAQHNVYFSTSSADGYLFAIYKSTELSATAYPFNVYKRTEFREGVKFDKDVQIGTDLTNANLEVNGAITADGNITSAGTVEASGQVTAGGTRRNPALMLKGKGDSSYAGAVFMDYGSNVENNYADPMLRFEVPSPTSAGALTGHYEYYSLPKPTKDRATDDAFFILTTKSPVTVAQGGTGYTGTTLNTSVSGLRAKRWGNLVDLEFLTVYTVNTSGSVGTIPSGYRPTTRSLYGTIFVGVSGVYYPGLIRIDIDGVTSVYYFNGSSYIRPPQGADVYGTVSFLVD